MNGRRWRTGESLMMVSTTPVRRTSLESFAASARVRAMVGEPPLWHSAVAEAGVGAICCAECRTYVLFQARGKWRERVVILSAEAHANRMAHLREGICPGPVLRPGQIPGSQRPRLPSETA